MPVPRVTFPIFISRPNGTFDTHGTGVAIIYGGRHYIATAAHVNDGDGRTDQLLVGQSPEPHSLARLPARSVCTQIPAGGTRDDDRIDLAVIPIRRKIADGLCATGVTFIGFDGLPLPQPTPGSELLFAGYPYQRQRFFPFEGGKMFVEPERVAVWTKQIPGRTAAELGYPIETHAVGRFLHAATRHLQEIASFTNPKGMSGGSVWQLVGNRLLFAGIISRWDQDGNRGHLVATRSFILRDLLSRAAVTVRTRN